MFNKFLKEGKELLSKRLGCNDCNCTRFDVVIRAFGIDLKCTKCGKEHSISIGKYENRR